MGILNFGDCIGILLIVRGLETEKKIIFQELEYTTYISVTHPLKNRTNNFLFLYNH